MEEPSMGDKLAYTGLENNAKSGDYHAAMSRYWAVSLRSLKVTNPSP